MNISLQQFFYVGLGGVFGSLSRFLVSRYFIDKVKWTLIPWGTLTVNLLGSFLMGLIFALSMRKSEVKEFLQLCLMTGFLGSFTTFSTYSLETIYRLQSGQYKAALINFILNNLLCFLVCFLGIILVKK